MGPSEWEVIYFVRMKIAGKEEETKFTETQSADEQIARNAYAGVLLPKRLEKASKTNDEFGTVVGVGKRLLKSGTEQEKDYLAAPPAAK